MVKIIIGLVVILTNLLFTSVQALNIQVGKKLYTTRCAMCHGDKGAGDGDLAQKSSPFATDFTACQFQSPLKRYPGVIVASLVLQPNGALIPTTLKQNGVKIPPHTWTDKELRAINQYINLLIAKNNKCELN